jgi:hypothetical protein
MRLSLHPHPDTPSAAVRAIAVEVTRPNAASLALRFMVAGAIGEVRWPAPTPAQRGDELWRHTCFEAFLGGAGENYLELNFSPSGRWAAYGFDGYRRGARNAEIDAPRIVAAARGDTFELNATIEALGDWARLGLSAVIEDLNGDKSYWALAHPAGKPDFHHALGFAAEPPGVEQA